VSLAKVQGKFAVFLKVELAALLVRVVNWLVAVTKERLRPGIPALATLLAVAPSAEAVAPSVVTQALSVPVVLTVILAKQAAMLDLAARDQIVPVAVLHSFFD